MNLIDLLLENQNPSNKIVNTILINSGYENSPRKEEFVQKINTLFPRYQQIRNGLTTDAPQVRTFLSHYDGTHADKFRGNVDGGDLKNPSAFTLDQLQFLIDEYQTTPAEQGEIDRELLGKTEWTVDGAEISKRLWYDPTTAVINLPGFRVYHPKNQNDSMKFGWYEEKLMRELRPGWHSWCVTWRRGSNRWGSYRSQGGTFYFIIDESKYESDSVNVKKYYLGAVQVFKPNRHSTGFEITDIENHGEKRITWQELLQIYPQLDGFRDQLVPVEYSEEELENQSVVGRMNENPGEFNFSRMARVFKEQYIDAYQVIKKAESWDRMDKKLREKYITLSQPGSFRYRFGSFELLRAIQKTNDIKLLNSEMIRKGEKDGVKALTMYLLQDLRPKEERRGIVNPDIVLIKSFDGNYGLFNDSELNWVIKGNDEYTPSFKLIQEKVIENPKTKERFYVDEFASYDGDMFIAITPLVDVDSYFLSKSAWDKIKDEFTENPDERIVNQTQDINEE